MLMLIHQRITISKNIDEWCLKHFLQICEMAFGMKSNCSLYNKDIKKRRICTKHNARVLEVPSILDLHVYRSILTCRQHICGNRVMLWCDHFVNDVVFKTTNAWCNLFYLHQIFSFLWKIFYSTEILFMLCRWETC